MRLRRVRFKNGTTMRVIGNREAEPADNVAGRILSSARYAVSCETTSAHLVGYVVVGLFSDGSTTVGYKMADRIPRALAVPYLTEILRRDMLMEPEANSVFDERFQWVD